MRVVIAEDAAVLREGLVRLLQDRGHAVVAAVADGGALLEAAVRHRPDVAVVDSAPVNAVALVSPFTNAEWLNVKAGKAAP